MSKTQSMKEAIEGAETLEELVLALTVVTALALPKEHLDLAYALLEAAKRFNSRGM